MKYSLGIRFISFWLLLLVLPSVFADSLSPRFTTTLVENSSANNTPKINKGVILVATNNLRNSSFKESVILVTHNTVRGTTGIAINKPSNIPLRQYFPNSEQVKKYNGHIYYGGPVGSKNIFLLINTEKQQSGMYRVADGLYFTRGIDLLRSNIDKYNNEDHIRAYAGYAGWGPGQLQNEIDRGDWTIVRSDPSVVFAADQETLWNRLNKSHSGRWI
ncbi:MAG: YqgE/AlgH family protein [Thiohalomonadales bacterium]